MILNNWVANHWWISTRSNVGDNIGINPHWYLRSQRDPTLHWFVGIPVSALVSNKNVEDSTVELFRRASDLLPNFVGSRVENSDGEPFGVSKLWEMSNLTQNVVACHL